MSKLKRALQKESDDLKLQVIDKRQGKNRIRISDIKKGYNPRKHFDNKSLNELAESIEKDGLLQPIVIDNQNNLISGERRLRAYKILGKTEIEFVRHLIISENQNILPIIENIQRDDLSIIDLAESIIKLKDEFGYKQTEIAKLLKKSKQWVSDILSSYRNIQENLDLKEKYDASYSNGEKFGINKLKQNKNEQLTFNFRWTLSDKIKNKMTGAEMKKTNNIIENMDKLKMELNVILDKIKKR